MIPHGVEIFVGLVPIDLRWSFDRLAGLVEETIGRKARSGALFVFLENVATHSKYYFLTAQVFVSFTSASTLVCFACPKL